MFHRSPGRRQAHARPADQCRDRRSVRQGTEKNTVAQWLGREDQLGPDVLPRVATRSRGTRRSPRDGESGGARVVIPQAGAVPGSQGNRKRSPRSDLRRTLRTCTCNLKTRQSRAKDTQPVSPHYSRPPTASRTLTAHGQAGWGARGRLLACGSDKAVPNCERNSTMRPRCPS